MATFSDDRAVKSLNTGPGRRSFVFKKFSQRIEEIDIDVYRSLDPMRAEPSEGSSFFRDCLVEYRELNTAEGFISIYEEIFPLVQTLPQIILEKDLIIKKLLSKLDMEWRLSHEPILRLIAALSRDLLEDFVPFLKDIVDSLESLLETGADRDPQTIEQIFTSWSYIMMYLQKYLTRDVGLALSITAGLRYYPKDYVREFMAESVSFLLRKAPLQQLKRGITSLMKEVVEDPSDLRKSGVGALLSHAMRITSSRLHSRTEILMPILFDESSFQIGDQSVEGSRAILEVLILAFERLCAELDPGELSSIWECLCKNITDSVTNGNFVHLSRLLSLLICMLQNNYIGKTSDYEPLVALVDLLLQTSAISHLTTKIVDPLSEVIDKILQLMLCIIDGLSSSKNMPALLRVSPQWKPIFSLRSCSLLKFIEDLLMKDPSIVHVFGTHILCALNNWIEVSDEEVVYLLINFCEKEEGKISSYFNGKFKEKFSRIHFFLEDTLQYWIGRISEAVKETSFPFPFQQNKIAVLWGVIGCYSHFADAETNVTLLLDFLNAIDELLMLESEFTGFPQSSGHSLIGAALRSYHKIVSSRNTSHEESALIKFLDLAKRHKSSPQILSAVADILDSIPGLFPSSDSKCQVYLSECVGGKVLDALSTFAENLCHTNKEIRLSTLRILCHYEPIYCEHSEEELRVNNTRTDVSEPRKIGDPHIDVLSLLRSIEETVLSITTSRKIIVLISKIQMSLSAHRIADQYIHLVLNGIISIFHNRFSDLWNPALDCLTVLIGQYCQMVWSRYIDYLENCQSDFLASHHQHGEVYNDSEKDFGLVGRFTSDSFPLSDNTPRATVLSLLIQALQKVPSIAESHSQQIVPLFLKFLGYNVGESRTVASHTLDQKGKGWKGVLKEWLSLFRLLRNPKAFYQGQLFREVLQHRLLEQNDADLQMKVLDCLLNWRDDFLLPYSDNLKNLIDTKHLRDEITKWSLSKSSIDAIDVRHRAYLVPIVIRILTTKVKNLKTLASRKNAGVHHRRAVLAFLAQLDVDELPLFFWLLIKPLLPISQSDDDTSKSLWSSFEIPTAEPDVSDILKNFTTDNIKALSWKKIYGFLHVVEDILAVFDESHLNPFLDLVMNCVVRILASCTSSFGLDLDVADCHEVADKRKEKMPLKLFKDMRSLCLKIVYLVLSKYDDHDFGGAFWDLFFTSIKPLIANEQEGAGSKRIPKMVPVSLLHCFLAMSKNYKLVLLLHREGTLVPHIFSMLEVSSTPDSILSCIWKFTKNLLKLDNELGGNDIVRGIFLPQLDVLICSLHCIFIKHSSTKRKRDMGQEASADNDEQSLLVGERAAMPESHEFQEATSDKDEQSVHGRGRAADLESHECQEVATVYKDERSVLRGEKAAEPEPHESHSVQSQERRQLVKFLGKRKFTIFRLLSKYVKEPSAAKTFVDILLSLLTMRHLNLETCVEVLQIIQQVATMLDSGNSKSILKSITPLFISAGLAARNSICDVLDALASNDSSVLILAKTLRELNATSEMEMGGHDFDRILRAYDEVNAKFFYRIGEDYVLPILAHAVHDMSSEELILRESASKLLLSFIEFCAEILKESPKPDQIWSTTNINNIVNNFLLRHMGNAMAKQDAIKKVWIDLLQKMVSKLPEVSKLESYGALCADDDAEKDIFKNIMHLQKHRRARALSRFGEIVSEGDLSQVVTNDVFVPLLFSILYDLQNGKDENIRVACMEALASISGCMNWKQYYALLNRCFRDLKLKQDKQKILLRLIGHILDHYHFSVSSSGHEAEASACDAPHPYSIDMTPEITLKKCTSSEKPSKEQLRLQKDFYPKIQKLLASDSDSVNVSVSLVALKLLKLFPHEVRYSQLPTIIHRISNFLKHRLESVRDEARSALYSCLEELGLEYLQVIVEVLKGKLKRGYELHVLGYTLNFLLSKFHKKSTQNKKKFLKKSICGELDYCLEDLLSVVENDILGDVSEQKEVEKIASKMKETRKQKSYETLKLIAQSITFKTHALKLLSSVTVHLNKQITQKVKLKLESMLNHIAAGIECNPSVDRTELFLFVHCLIKDGISEEGNECKNSNVLREGKLDRGGIQAIQTNRLVNVDRRFSHLITAFALGVLQNYMKELNMKREGDEELRKNDTKLLELLGPFVSLLGQCLSSKYENIIIAALRCLSLLVKYPLESLQTEADRIKNSLLVIAQGSVNANSQLTESCINLLIVFLRTSKVTLSVDQLHMLMEFPMFIDFAKNPTPVALSLLKAIVKRKLVVPEIYDLVQIVAELMVQSQGEQTRKQCSKILLQFLLGYHLSEKRLQQHLDFLLANLRYEHSTGRVAVLEMLRTIMLKFPRNVVDAQSLTMFVHLVVSLANDGDSKVRSMSAAAIKCLIGHVSTHSLHSILEYSLSWYVGAKQNLWSAAAQVLGLLVQVMGKTFEKHLSTIFPVMRSIFQSATGALSSSQHNLSDEAIVPFWKEAYYSMVMLEKILNRFPNLFVSRDIEDIWETICEFLLHPHLWLRNISARIISCYFGAVTDACRANPEMSIGTFFLMKPSILFLIAVSLCYQLKVPLTDGAAGVIITQNLVFSICSLHSFLEKSECDVSKFWSSLEPAEQERYHKFFGVLDPRKGRRTLTSFTSDVSGQHDKHQHPFITYLLQRMGKLSFQMEATQMKIVFNCYKSIAPKLLDWYETASLPIGSNDHKYAYQMLLPLYRVCEGYTGQVVSDDLKQLAQEVCESIRDVIGVQNFVQIYSEIRKNLKEKRDKRKQEEKIMAVVNPMRNAKRKLRSAAKHRAHKKRKMMTMKMGRWMR